MELNKEFVTYEEALALKELGFNEECFKYIYIGDTGNNYDHYLEVEPSKAKKYNEDDLCISQPLKQQVFRWFREKYGYDSLVTYTQNKYLGFVTDHKTGYYLTATNDFSIHEEAEDALIDKLIDLIKQQADEK